MTNGHRNKGLALGMGGLPVALRPSDRTPGFHSGRHGDCGMVGYGQFGPWAKGILWMVYPLVV